MLKEAKKRETATKAQEYFRKITEPILQLVLWEMGIQFYLPNLKHTINKRYNSQNP